MMAVGLTLTGNALGPGTPTPLFDHEIFGVRHSRYLPYAVTKDGQRFLIARPVSAVAPTQGSSSYSIGRRGSSQ
jgi:hypothetical protein